MTKVILTRFQTPTVEYRTIPHGGMFIRHDNDDSPAAYIRVANGTSQRIGHGDSYNFMDTEAVIPVISVDIKY